jgi:hypothetical protein
MTLLFVKPHPKCEPKKIKYNRIDEEEADHLPAVTIA